MSILNHSDLLTDISTYIFNNGAQAITGNILQQRLNNMADSAVNKLGDTGITGVLRYSTVLSISNSADLVHKNYVDTTLSTALLDYLNKDGSTPLTGDLNFNLHNATDIVGLYGEVDGFGRNASQTFASNGEVVINSYWGGPFPYQLYINSGGIGIMTNASSNKGYLHSDNLTANRIIQLPDNSGTIALLSDIAGFGSGTVTSVGITGSDFSISGSPVTTSGNIGLTLATVNSNIGTFNNVTVNGKGLVTAASNISYALQSTTLDINGVSQDLSISREWRTGLADTGVLTYGGATQASSTQINIGAVEGYIIDNETLPGVPTKIHISYAGASNVTVTTIGSGLASYLLLDSSSNIVFQNTFPTAAQRKTMIYLSKIGHPSGSITTVGNEPDFIISPLGQLRELAKSIGFINNGVIPSANGANLNFNISASSVYRASGNFVSNNAIPDEITVAAQTPASFLYRTQTGAGGGFVSLIDPTTYDNAGTSTAIAGSSNQATNQRIFLVPGLGLIIQKGQTIYSTLTDAIAAVGRESFVIYPSLTNNAILIGILSVTKGCIALNNTSNAQFFLADRFGQAIGSTAGISTATLQSAYNNSLVPQITVTDTLGAFTNRNGRSLNTSNVFEVQNIAGSTTASINGNGIITSTAHIINGTAGAGYLQLGTQSVVPTAVNNNLIIYNDSSNRFSIVKRNVANSADITRTLIFNDASVTYTFPSQNTDTLAGLGTAQTFTANQTIDVGSTLTVASNTDATSILGRAKIGSPSSNIAFFSHFNFLTTTGYGFAQDSTGSSSFNAPTGQTVIIKNNGSSLYQFSGTGCTFLGSTFLQLQSTTDAGSTASASMVLAGGIGIAKKMYIGDNIIINTAGKGLQIKSGSNARIGTSTLSGGTVTVSNTSVSANTVVIPIGVGTTNAGFLSYTISAGVSFTITSSNASDARTVSWVLIESV